MLYVGLGGTGCQIGAELERRLRDELCGPDGTALQDKLVGEAYQQFQLPSCLQFVYADLNEAELTRVRQRVVPGEEHAPAADRTQHLVRSLVPRLHTYPEVSRSLRANAEDVVRDWLPPLMGEPRVAPLSRGAGQLPTVGRAALFETFRGGIAPAQQPILEAIGRLNKSAGALRQLGGRWNKSCDVFVSFSVAGGTGSGIFYDYLHLIADAFQRADLRAQIYPLVVMPSAFLDGMGGGRPALLNAGRALLDVFRLVDDQNGQAAGTDLTDVEVTGALSVHYPVEGLRRIEPSTVQTAFLISRTPGIEREDLQQSMVSLMLSLIATGQRQPAEDQAVVTQRVYQSFADDFINSTVGRETQASSGVGNCGVSTALVASLTVPVDDLADIVTGRLLSEAVAELSSPLPGKAEANEDLIRKMFRASNIERLRTRTPEEFDEPAAAKGTDAITRTLHTRLKTLESSLNVLERRLATEVPTLASDFDPRRGVEQVLEDVDLFRTTRVMMGHERLSTEPDRQGFTRILEERRGEPKAPDGILFSPPQLPAIRRKLLRRARWGDAEVERALGEQNRWYAWRSRRAWHAAWAEQTPRWEVRVRAVNRELTVIAGAFVESARAEAPRFAERVKALYRLRTGVSYLLPPQGTDLELFYQQTLRRFVTAFVKEGRLKPAATSAELVNAILGADGWREAYTVGCERGPDRALGLVRQRIKQEVKRLFQHRESGLQPLLPPMADLLVAASGRPGARVGDDDMAQFRSKIAGLVPGGFSPQGHGPLKVFISYASASDDPNVERYLRQEVNLPQDAGEKIVFRSVDTESITVLLFRTSMSVTEVPELREVLRHWAGAVRNEQPEDYLRWRQRLGYDFGYLLTTAEHRVRILQRLLCALWNGQLTVVEGDPTSPRKIRVQLGRGDSVAMMLPLTPYGRASSWGSVVRAYEEWTLADDQQIRRDYCARLMATLPRGLDATPEPPSKLYLQLLEMREEQVALLENSPADSYYASLLHEIWSETLPAALDLPFLHVSNALRPTLRTLQQAVGE
jgi:hypothetical protein